jgi:Protein of unknown function (DUF3617)
MKRLLALAAVAAALPAAQAASPLTPGLYEYTVKMNMPGMPADMPPQTSQRCLTAQDAAGSNAYGMPNDKNSDCTVTDMVENGGQFSYKMACTRPQQFSADANGTLTATTIEMNMTMTMPEIPGPITQNLTARRIGDCKP